MNRIINGLKRLIYALGFVLGAFAFVFVGAYRLSKRCLWKAEDVMNDKLDKPPMPTPEKPYIDPAIMTVRDHFSFTPQCRIHPDAQIKTRDELFTAMTHAAFQTASHIRQTTGHTPETVEPETRLVTLNRTIRFKTRLAISEADEPDKVNISIPEDESTKWYRFGFAMKSYLN